MCFHAFFEVFLGSLKFLGAFSLAKTSFGLSISGLPRGDLLFKMFSKLRILGNRFFSK